MSYAVSITQDGTRLETAGKYVDQDIVVGISDSIKKTAATYTPGTTDQTIAAGQYLSGAQTVKGDANLIAGNIRSGKSIFGVAGSLTPGITPSGTKSITANGTYDVTEYASAAVNVPNTSKTLTVTVAGSGSGATVITQPDADFAAHRADAGATLCMSLKSSAPAAYLVAAAIVTNQLHTRSGHSTPTYGVSLRYGSDDASWSSSPCPTALASDGSYNAGIGQIWVDNQGRVVVYKTSSYKFEGEYEITMSWG